MTKYRCPACGLVSLGSVRVTLDPRHAWGYCVTHGHTLMTGEEAKAAGMARAESSAAQGVDAAWQAEAEAVARQLAATGEPFTVENITGRVGLPTHRNAVGALVNRLARKGVIVWTGQFVNSSRSDRHGNPNRVWRGRRAA